MDSDKISGVKVSLLPKLLLIPVFLSLVLFFYLIDHLFRGTPDVFVLAVVLFFILSVLFSVGMPFWQTRERKVLVPLVFVLPSLFFSVTLLQIILSSVAALLVFWGIERMQQEIESRIAFSFFHSVRAGFSPVIFALVLMVSGQYYEVARTLTWTDLVPNFHYAEGTGSMILKIMGFLSPTFSDQERQNMSVDEFLQELHPSLVQDKDKIHSNQDLLISLREVETLRSKTELSQFFGREIRGNERMGDLLMELIQKKLLAFASSIDAKETVPFLPFVLALLLFLTLYPIGSFLSPLTLLLGQGIFSLFLTLHFATLQRIPTEREVLIF